MRPLLPFVLTDEEIEEIQREGCTRIEWLDDSEAVVSIEDDAEKVIDEMERNIQKGLQR